jgi:hypothetical protein
MCGTPLPARRVPPAPAPRFEDDDLDADLVPTPDDELPLPEPGALVCRLDPRTRWLGGRPWSRGGVLDGLVSGPARRRAGLAFWLAVDSGGRHQLDTRALVSTQESQLAAMGRS